MPEPPGSLRGTGVSAGSGCGPVRRMVGTVPEPPAGARHGGDAAAEAAAALAALEGVAASLEDLAGHAPDDAGHDVLHAQALMARDPELAAGVRARVAVGIAAPRAVFEAFAAHREALAAADAYLAARVADLDDVRDRAVAALLGVPVPGVPASDEPFVLVARDLAPADTALLDPATVVAFVTENGGPTSHTAILARALGVPAVVAVPDATTLADGVVVLVDGTAGTVQIAPSPSDVLAARFRDRTPSHVSAAPAGPGGTRDGRRVPLLANITVPGDLAAARAHGAEGVGLYRTEFLFLDRADVPGTAEQAAAYAEALDAFPDGDVVVRVLDAGADKPLPFLPPSAPEPNPALGERGLRMLRRHPEILAGQLAALAKAGAGRPGLRVMAPMVTGADESAAFAAACRDAGLDRPGVMIEVPAAALRARDLARTVEFFSVGTNDLAQYACAADRQSGALSRLHDPWQPALLDLVALAAGAGVPCGVCGEGAADPILACVLVGLGVASLSMAPTAIPAVREELAGHTLDRCRAAAAAARASRTAATARAAARAVLARRR
ncbi:phosphoenolpyruvate--protein phosphotransferase [Actinomadura rayongensis]|uniref:Phosphoenolpyruvate-protein phosphotransferase n=1 Tax=Actinomadura rayongensis TaxID=1429076 RepID=A0A6I4W5N7_9ACTN|nr:phosphoenolpyruvate--protein phosphotransferase [Actinomadura rayongensis]